MRIFWLGLTSAIAAMAIQDSEPASACGLKLTVQAAKVKRMVKQSAHPTKILVVGEPSGNLESSLEQAGHHVDVAADPSKAKAQQYGIILVSNNYVDTAKTSWPDAQVIAMGKSTQKNLANVEDALERKPVGAAAGRELLAAGPKRDTPVKTGPEDAVPRRDQNQQPVASGSDPKDSEAPKAAAADKPVEASASATIEQPAAKEDAKPAAKNDEPARAEKEPAHSDENLTSSRTPRTHEKAAEEEKPVHEKPVKEKAVKEKPAREEKIAAREEKAERAEKPERPAKKVPNEVFFAVGSHGLGAGMKASLQGHARWLKDHSGGTLKLEGHADSTGKSDLNMALSERRVQAAARYLASIGVDKSRIQTEAFGDEKPVYQPPTNPQNRCVVVVRSE